MLHVADVETLSVSLLASQLPISSAEPPSGEYRDAGTGLITSVENLVNLPSTTSSIFLQLTSAHNSAADHSDQLPQTAFVVGPVIYLYFTVANATDAGFTVDLLFQHPDYLKASLCFIRFCFRYVTTAKVHRTDNIDSHSLGY